MDDGDGQRIMKGHEGQRETGLGTGSNVMFYFSKSRYRRSGVRLHKHCETCYSRRCRAPVEVSVSCLVVTCRFLCGATFHMCKEEEHALLCPNQKVPCLNASYGCPFTMSRSKLAKHLQVCPASVVCCSMDWNRWPVEDPNSVLYVNVLKEMSSGSPLDVSVALRDQKLLFSRLKMRSFFPELMEEPEEPETEAEEEGAVGGEDPFNGVQANGATAEHLLSKSPHNSSTNGVDEALSATVDKHKFDLYEKMFSMERGGCNQSESQRPKEGVTKGKVTSSQSHTVPGTPEKQGTSKEPQRTQENKNTPQPDISKTGLAPWQDGVLERLGQQFNPREYNMYLVHHGRMLISFGQIEACTPREKDFVYGSLEPIPVQTLKSYKPPVSFRQRRIYFKDPSTAVKTEHKCVGTSDAKFSDAEEAQFMDEMYATLLCSAEAEVRGHKISETSTTDALFVDTGTQTYIFAAAPFKYNATLADITEDKSLKLYVQMDKESVTSRHTKANSAFNFSCGHFFRRDEYAFHFKNVHSDIQSGLSGWFEQRCPLAYLGCSFTLTRFQPSTHKATVSYKKDLGIFILKPEVPRSLLKDAETITPQNKRVQCEEQLADLPFEVLRQIASYLDSFTLSQLALVSRQFREVCSTLLQERGMVVFKWKRKSYSHGGARWKSSVVWEYSNLFSKVNSWCFGDSPSISEHLRVCPFYQRECKTEPVSMTGMCEKKRDSEERQSLVTLFTRPRKT
ncbi:F-box only protein 40 [Chanos chanos]|uniref:F-box only protein 40 n=1 Tax=Chanos chanos TaxID=29144 RepID=A0A6J2VTP3_CHACN|nr:F-box only protein 40-like [Chanos chanos]